MVRHDPSLGVVAFRGEAARRRRVLARVLGVELEQTDPKDMLWELQESGQISYPFHKAMESILDLLTYRQGPDGVNPELVEWVSANAPSVLAAMDSMREREKLRSTT